MKLIFAFTAMLLVGVWVEDMRIPPAVRVSR
jgi:hypothetical protein